MAVERLALSLLRRGVAGDVGGHLRRLLPIRLTKDPGQPEVDDAQPAVVAEDQLRRRQLGVDESLAVGEVESPARLQPDHQRLRRREVAAAVEEVAQVAPRQVLDDHVHGAATTDLLFAPVVDGREVGVRQRGHLIHLLAEVAAERLRLRQLRPHQLDRDRAVELDIAGVGDQRVGAGGDRAQHLVAATDRAAVEPPAPGGGRRLVGWSVVAHVLTDRHTREEIAPAPPQQNTGVERRSFGASERAPASERPATACVAGERNDRHDGAVEPPPISRRTWPRFDGKLAVASVAIAAGLVMIGWAVVGGVTGDDVSQLPDELESIAPVPDAVQVLAQSQVVVDLVESYEGRLRIDGIDFPTLRLEDLTNDNVEPGEQVEIPPGVVFEPGNDTLTFTPGPGIEVERFDEGIHRVTVLYWPVERGEGAARSYSWTFNVV